MPAIAIDRGETRALSGEEQRALRALAKLRNGDLSDKNTVLAQLDLVSAHLPDEDDRLRLGKQLLKIDPCYFGSQYAELNLQRESSIITMVGLITEHKHALTNLCSSFQPLGFDRLSQPNAEALYRKILSACRSASAFLRHFPQLSDTFMLEIAPALVQNDPAFTKYAADRLLAIDVDRARGWIFENANRYPDDFHNPVVEVLTREQQLALVANPRIDNPYVINYLNKLTPEEAEAAFRERFADQRVGNLASAVRESELLTQPMKSALANDMLNATFTAAQKEQLSERVESNANYLFEFVKKEGALTEGEKTPFFAKLLAMAPRRCLKFFEHIESTADSTLETALKAIPEAIKLSREISREQVEELFERAAGCYPDMRPNERLAALLKSYPRGDEILAIATAENETEWVTRRLAAALIMRQELLDTPGSAAEKSRNALAELTGIRIPDTKFGARTVKELYAHLLLLSESLGGKKVVEVCRVKDSCFDKESAFKLISFFECFKPAMDLCPWLLRVGLQAVGFRVTLTSENLESKTASFERALGALFSLRFGLGRFGSGKAVRELTQRWGDISALTTLLGFYMSSPTKFRGVTTLREVCKAVLDGSFRRLKYADRSQLEGMNDGQVSAWQENPATLTAVSTEGGKTKSSAEQACSLALNILATNLRPHLEHAARSGAIAADKVREEIAKAEVSLRQVNVHAAWEAIVGIINNATKYKLVGPDCAEARGDLSDIKRALDSHLRPSDKTRQGLVFSVVTDDPKLLLHTGCLVDVTSCQDFRTGSYRHTLLGYVLDANIKLALAYGIEAYQCEGLNQLQFESLVHFVRESPEKVRFNFDHPKQILSIDAPELNLATTVRFKKASHRQILRAGHNGEQAALLAERAYAQPHALGGAIGESVSRLIKTFRESCGLVKAKGKVQFPPSRNAHNVYSDAGGGEMKGPYSISL